MPYVDPRVRAEFRSVLEPLTRLVSNRGLTTGELNYLVTAIMIASLDDALGVRRIHYNDLSHIVAAVRDAADEFKRRLMTMRSLLRCPRCGRREEKKP